MSDLEEYLKGLKDEMLKSLDEMEKHFVREFCEDCRSREKCSDSNKKLEAAAGFVYFIFHVVCEKISKECGMSKKFVEAIVLKHINDKIMKEDIKSIVNSILFGERTEYIF